MDLGLGGPWKKWYNNMSTWGGVTQPDKTMQSARLLHRSVHSEVTKEREYKKKKT